MAMQTPLANDKKRVKVYELRDNDWFDRGTGFCTGQVINVREIARRMRFHGVHAAGMPMKTRADDG
jgi:hypothetical protein